MKIIYFLAVVLILSSCSSKSVKHHITDKNGVSVFLKEGTLGIYPIANNAMRIKFMKDTLKSLPELIFLKDVKATDFKVKETLFSLKVIGTDIQAIVNKRTGNISFANAQGEVFLSEIVDSRKLISDTIQSEPCYRAELSFSSPSDESLFGLGQFQDGNFNIKSVSRRLTQVNSQIALPFIYSNKGYGLLWHQYGMTDYNPSDNYIELVKQDKNTDKEQFAEVTTISGTQKVLQNQSLYTGKFKLDKDGEYNIFLDLGNMGNRHYVAIDGNPVFDQSNMWLPPTSGKLTTLKAGEHEVVLICKSDNNPLLSWKLKDNTTTFRSPVSTNLDYTVFYGPSADSVIASYRKLTGNAPMFPKWAYGFWQCRERYTSGKHLVETVKEFRKRNLPVDVIVQDWQYWGNRGWGVPQFDETNYSDPAGFIKEIHDLNAHFNISIWSNPDKNSDLGKRFVDDQLFIPNTKWLDYFNPKTKEEYWNALKTNMFDIGVDSWWMDAVEPENDALKNETTYAGLGDFYRLTYPLMVSNAVYEGQRKATDKKRVCILTRSAFSGQQRYGVINWSGDIGGNWETFRGQIVAGLNYTISGMPYWTTDIGGFFRPGQSQYTDEKYHELLTRWFQWGVFNPIFRVHGYMSETEPWKYGTKVEENIRKMLNLRYQLLPYIYSEAWQITKNGSTMMRPLVMDFRNDIKSVSQAYEFMFGKSILVAPVVEPEVKIHRAYLPESSGWYDFWTGRLIDGGQTVEADVALDKIPLYIKSGSILPIGQKVQYSSESKNDSLEIRIYEGADCEFTLYDDEGDNYNYEKGNFSEITFSWNNSERSLSISNRNGTYNGMPIEQTLNVILISGNKTIDFNSIKKFDKVIQYAGNNVKFRF
ncbi:MAG: DUF5110 domain-containing protein [Prolixibacteraceae bacterium]|nr:DUF5110 domain-containing protein [Prolixibacteraceae bacterium]